MQKWTAMARHCVGSVLALSLVGCAVQTLPGGKMQVGIDNAELLGQTLASFRLADGSEGRLRVLGGKYSIKLQKQFQVVDIARATMVRVASANEVGGRTLVVLEKSEANCNFKTHLLAIQGSEVLSWDFGDCRTQPLAAIAADQATFDFVQAQRTTRYTYRDARLTRGEFSNTANGYAPNSAYPAAAVDASGPRYVPGPPLAWSSPQARPASSATAGANDAASVASSPRKAPVAATSVTAAARPAALPSAKQMDFPVQEQKPVRIVLDK